MTAGSRWTHWFPNLAPAEDLDTPIFPLFSRLRRNRSSIHRSIIAAAAAVLERLLLPYDISTVNADTTLCGNTHQLSYLNDSYTNALVAASSAERVGLVYGGDEQHSGRVRRFLDGRLWLWILKAAQQAATIPTPVRHTFSQTSGDYIDIYPPCIALSITHNAYAGLDTGWKTTFWDIDASARHPTLAGYGFNQTIDRLHECAMDMLYDIDMRGDRPGAVVNQNKFWPAMCGAQYGQDRWTCNWLVASGNARQGEMASGHVNYSMIPVSCRWNTELLMAALCMLEHMRTYYAAGKFAVQIPHKITTTSWNCTVLADGTLTMGSPTTTISTENFAGIKYQRNLSVSGGGDEISTTAKIEGDVGMDMFTSQWVRNVAAAGSKFHPADIDNWGWEYCQEMTERMNPLNDAVATAKTDLDRASAAVDAKDQAYDTAMEAADNAHSAWEQETDLDRKAELWAAYEAALEAASAAFDELTTAMDAKDAAQNVYDTAKNARDEEVAPNYRDFRVEIYEVDLANASVTILNDADRNAIRAPSQVTIALTRTLPDTEGTMTLDGQRLWGGNSVWPNISNYMTADNARVVVPERLRVEWPKQAAKYNKEGVGSVPEDPTDADGTWNKKRLHEFGDGQSAPKDQMQVFLDYWRNSPEQFLYNSVGGLSYEAINKVKNANLGEVTGVPATGQFDIDKSWEEGKGFSATKARVAVMWYMAPSGNDWHNNGLPDGQYYPQAVYYFNRETGRTEAVWGFGATGTWSRHINETARYAGMKARAQVDDETLKFTVTFGARAFSRIDANFSSLVASSGN